MKLNIILILILITTLNIGNLKKLYREVHLFTTVYGLKSDYPDMAEKIENAKQAYLIPNKEKRTLDLYIKNKKSKKYKKIKEYNSKNYTGLWKTNLRCYQGRITKGIYQPKFLETSLTYKISIRKSDTEKDEFFGCISIEEKKIGELLLVANEVGLENTSIVLTSKEVGLSLEVKEEIWEDELEDLIEESLSNY